MRVLRIAGAMLVILLLFGIPMVALGVLSGNEEILNGISGYGTVVVIAVLVNATVLIPTPAFLPLVAGIADQNSVIWVAGAYAAGSAIGESTSYLLGQLLNRFPAVRDSRTHQFLMRWLQGRKTVVVLFFLAAIPFPYDVGGAIAGNAKFPFRWFFLATFGGRWLKYIYLIPFWHKIEEILESVSWIHGATSWFMIGLLLLVGCVVERKTIRKWLYTSG